MPEAAKVEHLMQRLIGDDPHGRAFSGLLLLGRPAAASATKVVVRDAAKAPARQFLQCLTLLVELGPDGIESLDALFTASADAKGETKRQILDCILSIAPHTQGDADHWVNKLRTQLGPLMSNESDATLQQLAAEISFRSVQLGTMGGPSLHAGLAPEQLLRATTRFANIGYNGYRREMAAVLLAYSTARTPAETADAVQILKKQLLKKSYLGASKSNIDGKTFWFMSGPRNYRRFADALLRLQPEPAVAMRAHAYLLEHGLVHEQSRAIEKLRIDSTALQAIETTLAKLAAQPDTNRALRYEVITTIGMLSKPTKPSIECLQALAESEDKALAVRVKAVLRSLRSSMKH